MDGQTQGMIPPFLAMLYFFGLKVDLQLVFFRINRGWRSGICGCRKDTGRSGAALGSAAHSRALRARGEGLKTDLQDLLQIRIQQEIKYIHDYDSLFIPPRT